MENNDPFMSAPDNLPGLNDVDNPAIQEDREALLNSFLGRLAANEESFNTELSPVTNDSLETLSIEDYPALPVPTHLEKKLAELQRITSSIEMKETVINSIDKSNYSKYKVNYGAVLNPAQLAAVVVTDKPVLVIAGAGSGKTRVIVHRVSYLIEKGVEPEAILLLTFTRKASKEMLDRVATLLHDKKVGNVSGGTFHSFANHVLRKYANLINLPTNFTIIDTADSEDVIDLIRTELKFNIKDKRFPRKGRLQEIISYSRNIQCSIRDIVEKDYTGLIDFIPDIELILAGYTRYKQMSRILDFDDLMEVLNNSLKKYPRFRDIMQNAFQYIMVDEFQDTNAVQNEIVQQLAGKHRRIMVVGDDSQSIYAFRGADYENILRFPQVYPDCVVIKIEENYRSNQNILDFTNNIITNAKIGYKKKLFTQIKNQHIPVLHRVYGQDDEAVFIVDRICELIEQGISLSQIAVLNRADWHNKFIQLELSKRNIPYVVVGGFKFNERMHVKDIVAFLRLTFNPSDAVSWHRVLKYIGGIGQVTATTLIGTIQQSDDYFSFEAFRQRKFYNELFAMGTMLSKASKPEYNLTQKIEIIRNYYAPILKSREDDYLDRMQDVDVLIELSKKYETLDKFLSDFALDPPSKRIADQTTPLINEGEEKGKITISTVHSAKGLEWYAVFVPHSLEGLFPSNRAKNIEEMEEERRLFYVACSRAKEELYITMPRNVYSYDAFFHKPSRFLAEVEKGKYVLGE
ncbi:MAG: ATP-dependent helicase [Bacteroidota bacterium]|nr:ATP-dependent helicase [Bacteroidota bacterium]